MPGAARATAEGGGAIFVAGSARLWARGRAAWIPPPGAAPTRGGDTAARSHSHACPRTRTRSPPHPRAPTHRSPLWGPAAPTRVSLPLVPAHPRGSPLSPQLRPHACPCPLYPPTHPRPSPPPRTPTRGFHPRTAPHRPAGAAPSVTPRAPIGSACPPPPPHAAWIYLFFYFFLPVFVIFPPSLQRSRVGAPQRERTESSGRAIPAAPPPPPHGPPIGMGARSREGKWGVVPHGEGWGGTKGGTKGVPEGEPILGGGRSGGVSWGVLEGDPILRGFSWGCLGVGSYIGGGSWRGIPH